VTRKLIHIVWKLKLNGHSSWIVAEEFQFANESTTTLARGEGERSWAYAEALWNMGMSTGQAEAWAYAEAWA